MSYISAIRKEDDVLVWERDDNGRHLKRYQAPYYFYVKDKDGPYTSMYGDKLEKLEFDTASEYYNAKRERQSAHVQMFESDINPEMRILSEHYYNVPAPKLNVTYLDIEVDYVNELGFASIENPYAPINSVALYHSWSNVMQVIAVPPPEFDASSWTDAAIKEHLNELAKLPNDVTLEVILVKNESELLLHLIYEIQDSDVLVGWNSEFFDIPYTGKRLERYNKKAFKKLSFDGAGDPKWREVETIYRKNTVLDLFGRISLDYLQLFRKYEMEGRPSYKLAAIADEFLPDLPKLEYEGSLANLYKTNFLYFIRYNLRDTEILRGFEQRLGYVDLANQMVHLSTGLFSHVLGTLKLSELSVINACHHDLGGLVVNDVTEPEVDRSIKGALVLLPQIGLHEQIGSIDINSLYPSAIRSINISPETLRGQFVNDIADFEEITRNSDKQLTLIYNDGREEVHTAVEWKSILRAKNYSISGYGTVFDQTKQGIIPKILETWYDTRKKYQKLKSESSKEGDKLKATYYDKLQYVYKIKLNSFYGALSNMFFRFFDLRMGESTTGTGRAILKHQCRKVSETLDDKYNVDFPLYETAKEALEESMSPTIALHGPRFNGRFESESVIYGDTDSTYFKTHAENKDQAIVIANHVADVVNKSYPQFMRDTFLCNPGFDNIIKCGREIVSPRGIFVDKKRYILHVADLDGAPVDKMKVMGLETKKTVLPKWISTELNKFIERYLKGEQWSVIEKDIVTFKDRLLGTEDVMLIGLPKGINGVEDYTFQLSVDEKARVPGHVMAAIHYNKCRDAYSDKESIPIISGMKIKVFYLKRPIGRFKSIAIPTDVEQVPQWFLQNTEFEIDRDAHLTRLVDKPLQNILTAAGKAVPSKQTLFFDSLFD